MTINLEIKSVSQGIFLLHGGLSLPGFDWDIEVTGSNHYQLEVRTYAVEGEDLAAQKQGLENQAKAYLERRLSKGWIPPSKELIIVENMLAMAQAKLRNLWNEMQVHLYSNDVVKAQVAYMYIASFARDLNLKPYHIELRFVRELLGVKEYRSTTMYLEWLRDRYAKAASQGQGLNSDPELPPFDDFFQTMREYFIKSKTVEEMENFLTPLSTYLDANIYEVIKKTICNPSQFP